MASAVVGLLRVLLTANTSEFQGGMKDAAAATKSASSVITNELAKLSGQFKDAELGNKGFTKALREFSGVDVVGKANAYANAVSAIGGASKLTEGEQRKVNAAVTEAIAKYEALGKKVPADLKLLAAETAKAAEATHSWFSTITLGVATGELLAHAVESIAHAALGLLESFPHLVENTIKLGAELYTTSLKTGISVEGLSKLRFVAAQTGTDLGGLTNSIFKMEANLGAVGTGGKKARDAIKELGLNFQELKNAHPEEAFLQILDRMRELPTQADRAGVGIAIFAKGFKEIAQLANTDIRELIHEAETLGIVMTTDTAAAAKAAEDALNLLKFQVEGVANRIGAAFLPAVIGVSHDLSTLFKVAVDSANTSLGQMGGGSGFLATVSKAMGTGSGAILAQSELYYQLRDAMIAVVREGVEPIIKAFAGLMQFVDQTKIVFTAAIGGMQQITIWADKLGIAFLNIQKYGGTLPAGIADAAIASLKKDIEDVNKSWAEGKASIRANQASIQFWADSGKAAIASIEAGLTQVGKSHLDVAGIIKHTADLSRAAAASTGSAIDAVEAKQEHADKALANAEAELASSMESLTQGMIDQIETLLEQGKAEGDIVKVLKVTKTQVNEVQKAQKERIKAEEDAADERKKLAKDEIKLIGAHLDAFMDAKDKEIEAEENAQERLTQLGMSGAALKIRQLEVQRAAEIKAHKESKAAIDAFYDYEIKIALKTADTIDERMRRAGVVTKATHVGQLREEEEFYKFMLAHSDQFTKADIENQRKRVQAAKVAAGQYADAWIDAVEQIGGALSKLGGMIGGSVGGQLSGIGSLVSSFGQAEKAVKDYEAASAAGTATAMGAITAYLGAVGVAITVWRTIIAIADKLDPMAGAFGESAMRADGTLRDFQLDARLAGQDLEKLFNTKNPDDYAFALKQVQQAIADNKRMMDAYGLTWRDFSSMTQEFVHQTAKDLIRDFKNLTDRGVAENKALGGMSKALSQLVIDAIDTGKKIPAGLQPILEKLIRMGGLTDEAARKMLGLGEDTMPTLADITEAADRYGLKLDQLGPKVKQLSINDAAKQIVKDFDTLTRAGVPFENMIKDIPTQVTDAAGKTSTKMVGFHAAVQGLVTDALSMGLTIPAAMKPIIEKFILLGGDNGLVDQFGNKLTDTSGINFEEPISKHIDDLILKIGELIDTIKGVGDEFDHTASRARGAAEIIGKAIPRGSVPPPSTPPPPPGEEPAPSEPDYAVPRSTGGPIYATKGTRVLRFIPRGTDTVPLMGTPGEGMLNQRAMSLMGSSAFNEWNAGRVPELPEGSTTQNSATTNVTFERGAFEGVVVDSDERVEQLTISIAKVIRQGGKPLTVWQDLPLTRNG